MQKSERLQGAAALSTVVLAALAAGAGCTGSETAACLEPVAPVILAVEEALEARSACAVDADCARAVIELPCLRGCDRAVAVDQLGSFEAELADIAQTCPDCRIESLCTDVEVLCDQGTCDVCQDPGAVGDGRRPGDDCWEPPGHRCSDVDVDRPPVLACSDRLADAECCVFDRGCLPCGWIDCEAAPGAEACRLAAEAGGNGECPAVPGGTLCFDPGRLP